MLRLLLDEHISPDVAKGLASPQLRNRSYMLEWGNGYFLGQEDYGGLRKAAAQGREVGLDE